MYIYFDCEFDAVRIDHRFQQRILSIGACCYDEHHQLHTFYALVNPRQFKRITSVVKRMTQLDREEILHAKRLDEVLLDLEYWIASFQVHENIAFCSFGPDDYRTLLAHSTYENCRNANMFKKVIDLQKIISAKITHQGKVLSSTLSLDDMKLAYAIAGEVHHNALSDAIDLMHIYEASLSNTIDVVACQEIYERKEAKRIEVKRRQTEKMVHIIKERYASYHEATVTIDDIKTIQEPLELWESQEHQLHMHIYEEHMMIQNKSVPLCDIQMHFVWNLMEKEPYVEVQLLYHQQAFKKQIPLHYRNVGIFEAIMQSTLINDEIEVEETNTEIS